VKLTNEMVVPASLEEAWAVMLDIERVAPCLPGASIEGGDGDEYRGTMKIKLGPITSSFAGTLKIEEADEAAHRAVLSARARDSRGQGTAAASITSTMAPGDDGTRVTVETDLRVTGPAASFGRGVMQDVSARLMGQFAECLAAEMGRSGAGAAEPRADAPTGQAAPVGDQGVVFAGPLPPDLPKPPPTEAGVRWPAGMEPPTASAAAGAAAAEGLHETGRIFPKRADLPERGGGDVLDLGAIGRQALMRRAAPAGAVAAIVLLLIAVVLRRRSNR
jgi:carbon monoxide dehydrogenase subunit G